MAFDLEDRTLKLSKRIFQFTSKYKQDKNYFSIFDQLLRSATSIGANYREANESETKKEFLHKIRIAKGECKEAIYWLQIIETQYPGEEVSQFLSETTSLIKILNAIYINSKKLHK